MRESAILHAVRESAARVPDKAAIIAAERTFTFAELERQAEAAAEFVGAHARGDIIGLLLPNTPSFAWALLGGLWAGKTVAALPAPAPPPLLAAMVEEAGLRTVLTNAELAPRLAQAGVAAIPVEGIPTAPGRPAPMQARAQRAAVLLYTSGTTGRPKAVELSDENILTNVAGACQQMQFGDERQLAVLPLFHSYGLTATLLLQIARCSTMVLHERFVPRAVLQAIQQHRITALMAIASQYRLLIKEPTQADLSSLRICVAGAERLPEQVAMDFEARFGVPILQGYGVTETSPVIAINPPQACRMTSVGPPIPNVHVTIRENGAILPPGQTGEVCVEGPNVMLGYYNRPEATAQKIVNGVLGTGDLGWLDADGYIYLAGRSDDMVKIAGETVYPAEVEAALERTVGVEEAAVLAVRDEKRGIELQAFVLPKPGATVTEAALRASCREHLPVYKMPRSFLILEQFPRGVSGKLDKRALAAAWPEAVKKPASEPSAAEDRGGVAGPGHRMNQAG